MDLNESTMYMGIVIFGGLIIVAAAIFIFKSTPGNTAKGDTAQTPARPAVVKKETKEKKEKQSGPSVFSGLKVKVLGALKSKPAEAIIGEAPSEESNSQLPDLTSMDPAEPVTPLTEEVKSIDEEAEPVPPPFKETIEEAPSITEGITEADAALPGEDSPGDSSAAESWQLPEGAADEPAAEVEDIQQPEAAMEEAAEAEPAEEESAVDKPKSDNLFDMFKEEVEVESDASKFAKNLDDVDVHDLLEESQNLINYLSGNGGG